MPGRLFALLLAVQALQPPPAAPVYRAGVDLVQVDVTVLDRSGGPVQNLEARDFEVREDGRPQKVELAKRANARLYPLDARGLGPRTRPELNELAAETGGFLVENTNHFEGAVKRIADEAGTYYVLGYRPTLPPDGKFRTLSVAVDRANLTVSARRGYVAASGPASTSAPPTARQAPTLLPPAAPSVPSGSPGIQPHPVIPTETPPSPAGAVPVPPPPPNAVRLRPDANKNVTALAGRASADPDASAGWEAYQRGDLESARTRLLVAAARPDPRPWVLYALGQSDYALARFDDAIIQWERVRADAPDFEPVYFDLVDGYLQRKNFPKAARVLIDASRRWPQDADVFNALGVVDITGGALPDAISAFDTATKIAPNEAIGYFNLARGLEARYVRGRSRVRVGEQRALAVANSDDRENAIKNYRRCVALGGPYADAARAALKRLGASTSK